MKSLMLFLISLVQVLTLANGDNVTTSAKDYCNCGIENQRYESGVGGTKSAILFPWMVSISKSDGKNFCGGVLINRREVLTSARCVQGKVPSDLILTLGVHDLSQVTEKDKFKVKKIISHKDYLKQTAEEMTTYENDLALLILVGDITYAPNILPICLSKFYQEKEKEMMRVLGWGKLSDDAEDKAQRLQMLSRSTIPVDKCGIEWKKTFKPDQTLCMGVDGHNICDGDYGGPLQVEHKAGHWELAGIASTSGPKCGDKFPGVYTKIEFFKKWLNKNSELYSHCYK